MLLRLLPKYKKPKHGLSMLFTYYWHIFKESIPGQIMFKSLFLKDMNKTVFSKDQEVMQMHKRLCAKNRLRLFNESYSHHIIFNE